MLIEIDGLRVLTDPFVRPRLGPLARVERIASDEAVRAIDVVLVSHLHADHADPRSLRHVGRNVPIFAPRGAGDWLRRKGMRDVRELGVGAGRAVGPLTITAVPANHDGRRHPLGPAAEPIGFVVRGSRSVYFAGDTDLFDEMAELAPVDVALLPVGGWGPTVGPGHLDPLRAAEAAARIAPRVAIPIHWGTLALPRMLRGSTPPISPGQAFAAAAARAAPGVEVRLLSPGERTALG